MCQRLQGRRQSVDRGTCRPGIEPRNACPAAKATGTSGCRRRRCKRKARPGAPPARGAPGSRAVRDPVHVQKLLAREPGDPTCACNTESRRPHREVERHTPMMNTRGKSDSSVVPGKSPNKAEEPVAEAMKGRGLAKGNSPERNALRTQGRGGAPSVLERVRQVARADRKQRFTALLHHVYDVERLRTAYFAIRKGAAAGVDGQT